MGFFYRYDYFRYLMLGVVFLLCVGADAQTTVIVPNGSFESGDLSNWVSWKDADGNSVSPIWAGPNLDGDATKDGNYTGGIWNADQISDLELSQQLTGLAAGYYRVTCLMAVPNNSSTNQRLFAASGGVTISTLYGKADHPAYTAGNLAILGATEMYGFAGWDESAAENGPYKLVSLICHVTEGTLTLGVRVSGPQTAKGYDFGYTGARWDKGFFKFDNFTVTKLSSDASLSNISLSTGRLKNSFSSSNYDYQAILTAGTTTVIPTAVTTDPTATVTGNGAVDVSSGTGTSTILVTAQDGATQLTYTVHYTVLQVASLSKKHYYTFTDGAKDSPGDGVTAVDGTLNGGATISNGAYNNTSDDGYVSFDGTALSLNTYNGLTLETYIRASAGLNGDNWVILSTFGNDGDNFLFTSNTRGGWIGTTACAKAGGAESNIEYFPQKDDGNLHHIVTVLSNDTLKLYFDGVLLAKKGGAPLISDLGTAMAFLGKSPWWWDKIWKGSIDEFNIYEGELTASQINANATTFLNPSLATLSVAQGTLSPAFSPSVTEYHVTLPESTASVDVDATGETTGTLVTGIGNKDVSNGKGKLTVIATVGGTTKTYTINYWVQGTVIKQHSYTFTNGATDTPASGTEAVNGTVNGTAVIANGVYTASTEGDYISFDGSKLALSSYNAITMEAYIRAGKASNPAWTMLAYFGNSWGGNAYWMSVARWDDICRTEFGGGGGVNSAPGSELEDGNLHHVVSVLTPTSMKFYIDGNLVGTDGNGLSSLSSIGPTYAYLGASGWPDPTWKGSIDEFNIYEGELKAAQVAENYAKLNPNVSASEDAGTWPLGMYNNVSVTSTGKLDVSVPKIIDHLTIENGGTLLENGLTCPDAKVKLTNSIAPISLYVSSPVKNQAVPESGGDLGITSNYISTYDEASSSWATAGTITKMFSGKGYIVKNAPGLITFNGELNSGNVTQQLTRSGVTSSGFNLVGNPYPSYVDARTIINNNGDLEKTFWLRSKNGSGYVFDTYNTTSGLYTKNSNRENLTGKIPPMQAFWVRVNAATSFVFANSNRCHNSGTDTQFRSAKFDNASARALLRLAVSNGTSSDQSVIYFDANASNGFDDYDSHKILQNNDQIPEIYTVTGSDKLAINGLNAAYDGLCIPLGFKTGTSSLFTIKVNELLNLDSNLQANLIDNQLNTQQQLEQGAEYSFNSEATDNVTRFSVLFKSAGVATGLAADSQSTCAKVYSKDYKIVVEANTADWVTVYDQMGQKLDVQKMIGDKLILSRQFPDGVYIVVINIKGNDTYSKIVVR